tara:strand:- start:235 stop:459 length:225 start_codon:yes stop_codon:yes gene_type:complete
MDGARPTSTNEHVCGGVQIFCFFNKLATPVPHRPITMPFTRPTHPLYARNVQNSEVSPRGMGFEKFMDRIIEYP